VLERFGVIAEGLDHPEGVAWGSDGRLYAGGEAGQVYAIDLGGSVTEVGTTDGFLYGVTLDADANVYACDFGNASVQRVARDGTVTTWSAGTDARPMRVPNYAAFDEAGNLYVTDSGGWADDDGLLYRITPEGRTEVWSEDAPAFPNGCCLTAEGDALLVIESHARRVVRVPIEDDGSAGAPTPLVDLTGSQPDGIALADDGTMLIGCYRPDRIWRVDPDGRSEVLAEDPDGVVLNQPANIAFWGEAMDRIVVSSLGGWNLMSAEVGLVGLPLRFPHL
jgi:gluconolactonase